MIARHPLLQAPLATLTALALLGACEGGQTGTPDRRDSVSYDAGCQAIAEDLDASTPLGFAPQQLWDAFEGSHETVAYWRAIPPLITSPPQAPRLGPRSYDEPDSTAAVALRIEIERDLDGRLPPVHCDNRVGVPVRVHLETDDGLLDADFDSVLVGEPGRARLELGVELGIEVTGWIELGEPIAVELQPLGDSARSLIAPAPCGGDAQWALDDPRWGVSPVAVLDALALQTATLRFRPEGSARVQLAWAAGRATACREGSYAHLPVQLIVTDLDHDQTLFNVLGSFSWGIRCDDEGSAQPTTPPATGDCLVFAFEAAATPALGEWRLWPTPVGPLHSFAGAAILARGEYALGEPSGELMISFGYNRGTPRGAPEGGTLSFGAP